MKTLKGQESSTALEVNNLAGLMTESTILFKWYNQSSIQKTVIGINASAKNLPLFVQLFPWSKHKNTWLPIAWKPWSLFLPTELFSGSNDYFLHDSYYLLTLSIPAISWNSHSLGILACTTDTQIYHPPSAFVLYGICQLIVICQYHFTGDTKLPFNKTAYPSQFIMKFCSFHKCCHWAQHHKMHYDSNF